MKLDQMEILDISPTISPRLAVFPGDTPFHQEFLMEMPKGHHLTLSAIHTTVHLGAHADAPNHYSETGADIQRRPLELYLGAAQVIALPTQRGQRIQRQDLAGLHIEAPRVLFKTLSFPNPEHWNDDFVALSAEVIHWLADEGVRLVGIDTPSIDPATDQVLESHRAVAQRDLAVLEGLVLNHVPPGLYQLVALPLPMEGADASPVRAVLLKPGAKKRENPWKRS